MQIVTVINEEGLGFLCTVLGTKEQVYRIRPQSAGRSASLAVHDGHDMHRCSTATHFKQTKFFWQHQGFKRRSNCKATHLEGYKRGFLDMNCLRDREMWLLRYKQTARTCSQSSSAPELCTSPLQLSPLLLGGPK